MTRLLSVALLAAGLVAVPAVHREGKPPEASVRSTVLTPAATFRANAVGTDPGWTLFDPVASQDTMMVAADWGGRDDVEVQARALEDGSWTEWFTLTYDADHGPDPADLPEGQAPSTASDPLWLGATKQIQLRAAGPVTDLELIRVDLSGGDGLGWMPAELQSSPGAANAASPKPAIVSRASWGADESIRRYTPREFNRVNFAIVHHTAGRNDYTREEADDIMRAIYAYHVRTKGWDDIAYNFLVDRFGTVWEGRYGGITRPVIGGHASGFNGGSVGISAIGNFQSTEPTQEMVGAIRDLLAWKLDVHHIDPHAHRQEISGGGSSSRTSAGTRVNIPTIIGHRTTNNTACPGDKLFEYVMGINNDPSFPNQLDDVGHPKAYGGPPQEREQPLHGTRPRWDISFTRAVTWQLTIIDQAGRVVRRGTGSSDRTLSLAWDLRDRAGRLVAPGSYLAQLDAKEVQGDQIMPVTTVFEVAAAADRRSGTTRTATAAELSSWSFPQNERVVIASSEAFPDALVAGPLAGSLDAPILLVPSTGVPPEVVDELRRLHAAKAYIVGGTGRITPKVEADLRAAGITSITRLAGADRYETSAAVAKFLIERDHPTQALLALGDHPTASRAFPDALSAGAFGAAEVAPVLLTATNILPGPIDAVLGQRPWFDGLVVFGGLGAISQGVADAASLAAARNRAGQPGAPERAEILRFAGTDRYETSALAANERLARVAKELERKGPSPYDEPTGLEVVLASGLNWPDALGASAAAARRGAAFLLVAPDQLASSPATRSWLQAHATELAHGLVSGGPGAVADGVVQAVGTIIASQGPSSAARETWPGESALIYPFPTPIWPAPEPEPQPVSSPSPSGGDQSPAPSEEPTGTARVFSASGSRR